MLRPWTQYVLLTVGVLLLLHFLIPGPATFQDDTSWQLTEVEEEPPAAPDNAEPIVSDTPLRPVSEELTTTPQPLFNPYGDDFLDRQRQAYSKTLVVAALSNDTLGWIKNGLSDMPDLQLATYITDDESAPLKVPANKGNEAMVYLSYIIDHYDVLPDVSIFMHAHGELGTAWHNEELLDRSSMNMVHRFNAEKAVREGFVQLKCEHDKTCTADTVYLHPVFHVDPWEAKKGIYLAEVWSQLFPHESMPTLIVNQVGAQFAVSREAIRRRTKLEYEVMRLYLLSTEEASRVSGRVFEWIWHYIFTSNNVNCPNKLICFCDTYSVCFKDQHEMDVYDALYRLQEDITWSPVSSDDGLADELHDATNKLQSQLQRMKENACSLGNDEESRRQILYDNWERLRSQGEL